MRAIPLINDEQWSHLLEQAAEAFTEVTLSLGFTYFKQERVETLILTGDRIVKAHVAGSEDYQVTLYIDNVRSSSCTCPVHTGCKHLAAVLMALADRSGYSASQVVNAKHYVKRAQSPVTTELQLTQLPGMDILGWHTFMNQYSSNLRPLFDLGMYKDALWFQLQNIQESSAAFSEIDWAYFELHQQLFILKKLNEQNAQNSVNYYTHFALYRAYDELQSWLRHTSEHVDFTASKERLQQTLQFVRDRMAEENGRAYLEYGVYTALWKYAITPQDGRDPWISRELQAITQLPEDQVSSSLRAAKAFLLLQQSKSGEAWAALEAGASLDKAPAALFLPFLQQMAGSGDWSNLMDWLLKCSGYFYGKKTQELNAYFGYWKETIDHLPEAEGHMWRVLEGMLPHSTNLIENMLYEKRQWKNWIELQIVQNYDPLNHRVSDLQPIEKEAPQLLLPYYHQAIDSYIALKNRQDYKRAVKLLKRLMKVYKKMKQTDRWERFLAEFTDRYSRLRALQEELKKGKLLE